MGNGGVRSAQHSEKACQLRSFYRWKSKYSGIEVGDAKKHRTLEDESRRLKQLVADVQLDNPALKARATARIDRESVSHRGDAGYFPIRRTA